MAPPAVERRELPADGFVSSAGNPVLGQKYQNHVPSSPITPAVAEAAPAGITPELQNVLDVLQSLTTNLESSGVTIVRAHTVMLACAACTVFLHMYPCGCMCSKA